MDPLIFIGYNPFLLVIPSISEVEQYNLLFIICLYACSTSSVILSLISGCCDVLFRVRAMKGSVGEDG